MRLFEGLLTGAVGGVLLWALNAVRPIAAILFIALGLYLVCLKRDPHPCREWARRWLPMLGAMAAVYMALLPVWNGYIARRIGEEPASAKGYSILVGLNPASGGSWNQEDSDRLSYYSGQPGSTAQSVQESLGQEAWERMASDKAGLPGLLLRKLRTFLAADASCVTYSTAVLLHVREFAFLCNGFYYLTLMLAIMGALRMWRERERSIVTLVPLYFLGLTLAQLMVEVAGRYHYSLLPILLLMGQYALFYPPAKRIEEREEH